jgi:hypothetical protein
VILKAIAALLRVAPVRIWVDIGTLEGENAVSGARRLRDALLAKGWKRGTDLEYVEQEGGRHDETSWGSRVPGMLSFLYGTPKCGTVAGAGNYDAGAGPLNLSPRLT